MRTIGLITVAVLVLLVATWVLSVAINYIFAASFLAFVFGGPITFWKTFFLVIWIVPSFSLHTKE
jgi:hypothetical protein